MAEGVLDLETAPITLFDIVLPELTLDEDTHDRFRKIKTSNVIKGDYALSNNILKISLRVPINTIGGNKLNEMRERVARPYYDLSP